jgi:hypothetical protein
MKRRILLSALLIYCLNLQGQVIIAGKRSVHFPLPGVHITLSNNFIETTHAHSPHHITPPVNESITLYGKEVIISIVETGSRVEVPAYAGFSYKYSSFHDKPKFNIKKLQVRLIKNNVIILNWTPVTQLNSFTENAAIYKNGKPGSPKAYWLLKENMVNSDSVKMELRSEKAPHLLTLYLLKKEADTQPFLMYIAPDKFDDTEDNLLQKYQQISKRLNSNEADGTFFKDQPGKGFGMDNMVMMAHTHLSLFFRKRWLSTHFTAALEYRLQGGPFKADWLPTEGIIIIPNLRQGTNYKLEVRFKAYPEQLSEYTFYVPPAWYNTLWFKILMIALLAIIVLVAVFRIRMVRSQRKTERYRLEIKALYAQMNPHFLFNALGSIQGLMNDAKIEKANQYLNGFASLLRNTIQMGNKETILLTAELKNLHNYIQLEKFRFGFQYIYEQDEKLLLNEIEIPPLLAQPIIENAVKHGISGKRENGKLTLSICKEQTDLLISVIDNGRGFNPEAANSGYGIKLTNERIDLFNHMHKTKRIILQVYSSGTGTEVVLRFKNWLNYD